MVWPSKLSCFAYLIKNVSVRVNCQLSPWEEWSACSVSCGGGNRTRVKTVVHEAEFGVEESLPEREKVEQCSNVQCCVPGVVAVTVYSFT